MQHHDPPGTTLIELGVLTGPAAGTLFVLGPGSHVVGRDRSAAHVVIDDPSVSAVHAGLEIGADGTWQATDLGSTNGTRVTGATMRLGAVIISVTPRTAIDDRSKVSHSAADGTAVFNRSPRLDHRPAPVPLRVPAAPSMRTANKLRLSSIVLPLAFAVVVVSVTGNTMFALLALLSPVVTIGSWGEDHWQLRRERRTAAKKLAREVRAFGDGLRRQHALVSAQAHQRHPGLAEICRRADLPSRRLWERRAQHDDAFEVVVGYTDRPWRPSLEKPSSFATDHDRARRQVLAVLDTVRSIEDAPLTVSVASSSCVGIVGSRAERLAMARSLVCQAAVLHGPADVRIAVLCDPDARDCWQWMAGLPHCVPDPARAAISIESASNTNRAHDRLEVMIAGQPAEMADLLAMAAADRGPLLVLAVDAPRLLAERNTPLRSLLARLTTSPNVPLSVIVLAETVDRLPSAATQVIELDHNTPMARVSCGTPATITHVIPVTLSVDRSTAAANALSRYVDSDALDDARELPTQIELTALLGLEGGPPGRRPDPTQHVLSADALVQRWSTIGNTRTRLAATLGLRGAPHAESSRLTIDLVSDGPHVLVAGTTGAGKSELLRTWVAALASTYAPDHLNFVLIDYKGGSAFAECAQLPHTVGVVTDLDEHLAQRVLVSLEAELSRRERVLRDAGVSDISMADTLTRLLVVVDEFATLAADVPGFIDSLVGIAQRGRSLGMHLMLATQRPSGSVSDAIRANTNTRVCLRVQSAADSVDVVGAADAAAISRRHPGRAYVRLGPSELILFQAALTTAERGSGATTLSVLADRATEAAARMELAPPWRPWPEPLPDCLELAAVTATGRPLSPPIGMADIPAEQRQEPYRWNLEAGPLLVVGAVGSGVTNTLTTVIAALVREAAPSELHVHIVDHANRELERFAGLPHVGNIVTVGDDERRARLLRWLRDEAERRRASGPEPRRESGTKSRSLPRIVFVLDGYSAFRSDHDNITGHASLDIVHRLVAEATPLGIHVVIGVDRLGAMPASVQAQFGQKLVLRLGDRFEAQALGLAPRADDSRSVPGRGRDAMSGHEVQVALTTHDAVAGLRQGAGADARETTAPKPVTIGVMPSLVRFEDWSTSVMAVSHRQHSGPLDDEWTIPLGIGDRSLESVGLTVLGGEGSLFVGPARSGRSSALALVLRHAVSRRLASAVIVVAPRPSPLTRWARALAVPCHTQLPPLPDADRGVLVLVDDAELVDDRSLEQLLAARRRGVCVVAAGRGDALRTMYGHWTQLLRRTRRGFALRPNLDIDGDLWATPLPRRIGPFPPGRGCLVVDGEVEVVQLAWAGDPDGDADTHDEAVRRAGSVAA